MQLSFIYFFLAASLPLVSSTGPLAELAKNAVNEVVSFFTTIDGQTNDSYLANLAETVCDATFAVLAIDGLNCSCTSSLIAGANSAMGEMECSLSEGCLDEKEMFCGKGDMNGSLEAGQDGIGLQLTSCMYIDVDLNLLPDDDLFTNSTLGPYDICVSASSQPGNWGFDECSATLGGEYCECTVCQNFGVIFDCSAIGGPRLPLCRTMILDPIDPVDDDFTFFDDFIDDDDASDIDDDEPVMDDFMTSGKGSRHGKASKSKKGW